MSIESDLSSIAKSLELIASHLTKSQPVAPAPAPAPVIAAPVVAAPVIAAPVVAAVEITPVITKDDFVSTVMNTYKALGPVKGQAIQEILLSVGAKNINDALPEQYSSLMSQIKALA